MEPKIAWQGKTMAVYVDSDKKLSEVEGMFLDKKIKFFPAGKKFRGMVGIPLDQKPGKYRLWLKTKAKDGSTFELDKIVKVWATKFGKAWLRFPPAKKKLMVRKLIDEEWAEIEKTLTIEASEERWEGRFIKPVEGKITMAFGTHQYINGKKRGQHRGVDLRAKMGTPVKAPNSGIVVFAKILKAFGGTMVIDHGQGIHTLYFHLSKISAKVGERVSKGEIIGYTGSSGIATGPHLHWGMSVHNVRVDPMQWVRYEF